MPKYEQFVILTWNQASGQPELDLENGLYQDLGDALEDAAELRARTASTGRRERHTVHRIDLDDEIEGPDHA